MPHTPFTVQTVDGKEGLNYRITDASDNRVATCFRPDNADEVCRLMNLGIDYARLASINADLLAVLEKIAASDAVMNEIVQIGSLYEEVNAVIAKAKGA